MDLSKLKIEEYNKTFVNFPENYYEQLKEYEVLENINCIFYYISLKEDIEKFVNYIKKSELPDENRVILVYEKGKKAKVNRDDIRNSVLKGEYEQFFKARQPILSSLSKELSAFSLSYITK